MAALESAAAAGLEEVRGEGAGFMRLLAAHISALVTAADGAARRAFPPSLCPHAPAPPQRRPQAAAMTRHAA